MINITVVRVIIYLRGGGGGGHDQISLIPPPSSSLRQGSAKFLWSSLISSFKIGSQFLLSRPLNSVGDYCFPLLSP